MYRTGFKAMAFICVLVGLLSILTGAFKATDIALFAVPNEYITEYYYNDYHSGLDAMKILYDDVDNTAGLSETEKNQYEKQITDALKKGYSFYVLDKNNSVTMTIGGHVRFINI